MKCGRRKAFTDGSIMMCGVVLMAMGICRAQVPLSGDTVVTFATAEEGRKVLTARDEFVRVLSPFDRAARVKTDKEVPEKEYLELVGRSVRDWTEPQKAALVSVLDRLRGPFDRLALPWPKTIQMIQTTGEEEGGAAYTRNQAVILSQRFLAPNRPPSPKLVAHELFHVLSRHNPGLRDRLYQAVGFEKCAQLEFPEVLKDRKITNPDAPANDHCIRVRVAGAEVWAVPILFSRTSGYDLKTGGEFFQYMEFRLLLVERREDPPATKPLYEGLQPRLVEVSQVAGFYEQVGRNTQYIIHPEEILADNFAELVLEDRNVPSPEILQKMQEILTAKPAGQTK